MKLWIDLYLPGSDTGQRRAFPTGISRIDHEIRKELALGVWPETEKYGHTHISYAIIASSLSATGSEPFLEPVFEGFNNERNRYEVWVKSKTGVTITPQLLGSLLFYLDENRGAPDSWLAGGATIISGDISRPFGYENVELIPEVDKVFMVNETQVDLSRIPIKN